MANTTIGVNLKFSADVSAAKQAMQNLQTSLAQISSGTRTGINPGAQYAKDLNQASQAAAQLRIQLQNAFNQDTGKLDLNKFNYQMKQSGMSVEQYRAKLSAIGPQGQQAFTQLAQAIATADVNTVSLSAGLQRLGATFMNTLRYQLSSSLIMGFTQGIGNAISYVKDLNESLTDIRIVTGYGKEEMEAFAEQANKAAKALSTTTNEYAKASLIYFQQGLNGEQVQKRTNATVKMAQVTGQSMEVVSDQLTAVWNNFYDGSKSLEYYADVITKLGAATASSSDEITQGLEKFAAVAETVGLSYEYATAALTTVTATTRQSADVVGTAFKTLFARIQDLDLGKTLDDGTTLGEYSEALNRVGINIKDSTGGLKDMNIILDEMGSKWKTLDQDQQVALAKSVAGVRQYTQLIALMQNYDFFKENLATAQSATGELQNQADIYAESWQAASDKVAASIETIYNKLLDDDFFIGATNAFGGLLEVISSLIDGLGGMPGLLSVISVALTRIFSTQLASGINSMAASLSSLTASGRQKNAEVQQSFADAAVKDFGTTGIKGQQGVLAKEELGLQTTYIQNQNKMSKMDKQVLEYRMNQLKIQKDQLNSELEEGKVLEQQALTYKKISQEALTDPKNLKTREGFTQNKLKTAQSGKNPYLKDSKIIEGKKNTGFLSISKEQQDLAYADYHGANAAEQINQNLLDVQGDKTFASLSDVAPNSDGSAQLKSIDELKSRLEALGVTKDEVDAQMQDEVGSTMSEEYKNFAQAVDKAEQEIKQYQQALDKGELTQEDFEKKVKESTSAVTEAERKLKEKTQTTKQASAEAIKLTGGTEKSTEAFKENGTQAGKNQSKIAQLRLQHKGLKKDMDGSTKSTLDFGETMAQSANLISTVSMAVSSAIGLFQTLSDESIEPSQKITTVLTTLSFMLPMIITLFNEQNKALLLTIGRNLAVAGSQDGLTKSMEITSFSALKLNAVMKGLRKTLGKFAIYAAAIAAVVIAVKTLADAADNARNSAKNFAASAAKGAKDMADAYTEATNAFNKLNSSIEKYEDAISSMHKLTEGTNEYKQALFDANEQALALIQSHAGLKYYIDSNGLIIFQEGELERIEEEAQQKKVAAYTAKLQADRTAREANIENEKVLLGRKLKGKDTERNDEDVAATETGAAIGAGVVGTGAAIAGGVGGGAIFGAKFGAALGSFAGPVGTLIGAAVGVAAGALVGAFVGDIASAFDNDATDEEKKAMDAIYEAYKEQGEAALSEEGIREALGKVDIDDENLIKSLAKNDDALRDLIQSMDANTAATWAETQTAAREQAHALDSTLQYKDSLAQQAITESLAKVRKDALDQSTTVEKDYYNSFWNSGRGEGKKQAKQWANDQGLQNFRIKNFTDKGYLTYEYYDEEQGKMATKDLQYSALKAWEQGKEIDKAAEEAYQGISNSISKIQKLTNGEGLLSIVGGQNLMSLSEKELNVFKESFTKGEFNDFIRDNWKTLGYESAEAFSKTIGEGILNWDYETAFGQFSSQLNAEIKGVLEAGAEETEYTAGALENYTEALAENTKGLHDNSDAWKNLEKKKMAAQAAVANAKTIKGIDALSEVLEDNIEILKEWDEASLDTWEAADKVQTALEDVFGLRVSANFIKEWLIEIGELANGNTENLQEMSKAAAIDFALNLDTATEENRNWFASLLQDFADQAEAANFEIGMTINDSEYIEKLNAMLDAGEITAEQVQQAFGALGYVPDIKYETKEQEIRTESYVFAEGTTDTSDLSKAKPIVTITKNKIQVPYVAGKGSYKTPGSSTTAADGTTTTSVSGRENGKGLTLMRDVGSIDASIGADEKTQKSNKKSIERYKEINEQLSDIERNLDKIGKAKDRAFGQAKVNLIQKEIDKQKEFIAAQEEYLRQIKEKYKEDWQNLDSQFKLDKYGRIENYTEVLEKNKDSNNFDELKEGADQYIETLNSLEEQQEKVNDEILKMQDMELEKISYEVEYKIEFNDREIKRLEFLLGRLDDSAMDAAKSIALMGKVAERNFANLNTYLTGIDDTLLEMGMSDEALKNFKNLDLSDMTQEDAEAALSGFLGGADWGNDVAVEKLKGYIDSLYSTYEALDSFHEDVMGEVNKAFDDMNEKADRAANRVEFLGATLENYQNIIDLVGKKALGVTDEQIRALSKARVEQSKTNLEIKQGQLELNESALEAATAELKAAEEAGDTEAVKHWTEQVETIRDNVWQLQGDVESAWNDTLQVIADDFANAIDIAIEAFEKAMSGSYGSFDKMQKAFDQQQEVGDRFVSNYQKIYELSKLNRDINSSINDTNSIKGKQELIKLQKDINMLQESDTQLSQYDLEFLQKKYDLRLAEIALEEAQNAKSQVRMRRDSEGNWAYVYTADRDKVDDAAQKYEDALYNVQQHSQDYIDEMEERIIQSNINMIEELANLKEEDFESTEAFEAEKTRIIKFYTDERKWLLDEMNKALTNSNTVYNEDWLNYEGYNNKKLTADSNWRTQFTDTFTAQTGGYTTVQGALSAFTLKVQGLTEDLGNAYLGWKADVDETFKLVKKSMDDFGGPDGTLEKEVNAINEKIESVGDKFTEWKPKAESGFQSIITTAANKYTSFASQMDKYKGAINGVITSLNRMIELAHKAEGKEEDEEIIDGVVGDAHGGKQNFPHENPGGGTKKYYGTYTIDGTTYRTETAYSSKSEAERAAQNTASSRAKDLIRFNQYNSSTNSGVQKYANSTQESLISNVGAISTKDNTYSPLKLQNNIKSTIKLNGLYLSNDTDFKYTNKKIGEDYLVFVNGTGYYFNKEQLEQINSKLDNSSFKTAFTSGSGDLLMNDSGTDDSKGFLEKNDRVYNDKYPITAFAEDLNHPRKFTATSNTIILTKSSGQTIQEDGKRGNDNRMYYYAGWSMVDGRAKLTSQITSSEKERATKLYFLGSQLQSYDTGGYTGSWDSSGRLAMLHQKEIVLNAADTENFLAAINIVRDIAKAIDLQAVAYQSTLGSLVASANVSMHPQTVQQDVVIHAEFPNATNHSEIEAAFDNLINRASQFANRKN